MVDFLAPPISAGMARSLPCHPPLPNLCAQVRASRGLQRTNKDLSDGMAHSLLCRLRWSGRPEDQATLAVILLKVGGWLCG